MPPWFDTPQDRPSFIQPLRYPDDLAPVENRSSMVLTPLSSGSDEVCHPVAQRGERIIRYGVVFIHRHLMLIVGISVCFELMNLKGCHDRLLAVKGPVDLIETGGLRLVKSFFNDVPIGPNEVTGVG